ncbi:MAG: toll/interleukin-1 receptor domain-containing protein [Anaerolineae bacterium]
MSHIFISYSKQDIEFVRYLRALLEAEGFAIWMDEARLTPSARWWKAIEHNVETCSAFVVVMSPSAYESDWVEREILLAEKQKRPIFPVLLAGEPWSRLANIQYEDLRAGLRAKLSATFKDALRKRVPLKAATAQNILFRIEEGDVTRFEADVMAFKYARSFHGADQIVAATLEAEKSIRPESLKAEPGQYSFVATQGAIAARNVLYIGTPALRGFRYPQIREFAAFALRILSSTAPETRHVAMTIHGPGFGLDEAESVTSQFLGYRDALQTGQIPPALEQITIIERKGARVERMRATLDALLKDADYATPLDNGWGYWLAAGSGAGGGSTAAAEPAASKPEKAYAYVIMPAQSDEDDLFTYGIQGAVHARGLLCEQPTLAAGDGDDSSLLDMLRTRIGNARVVVAELTNADHAVYLQLGYAWGKGIPTLVALKNSVAPTLSDVPALIRYTKIKELETSLTQALDQLRSEGKL